MSNSGLAIEIQYKGKRLYFGVGSAIHERLALIGWPYWRVEFEGDTDDYEINEKSHTLKSPETAIRINGVSVLDFWSEIATAEEAAIFSREIMLLSGQSMGRCWQPINTAPKDGTKVLLFWGNAAEQHQRIEVGQWHDNRNAKNPRPYWEGMAAHNVRNYRQFPPSHWQPLVGPS